MEAVAVGGAAAQPPPRPAGREVELFNETVFRELRAHAKVPDDFINTGWNLDTLQNGGGKGGSLMTRVGTAYMVKEMSKSDHLTLLEVAGKYAEHVRGGETLLCPMYAHFQDKASGRIFFAMRNSIGVGPFAALYDLKGCADDKLLERSGEPIRAVHKRIWNAKMWLGQSTWTPERKLYHSGKVEARSVDIEMTAEQRETCLRCIERDTRWLAEHELMDYSLLVAIKEVGTTSVHGGHDQPTAGGTPFRYTNREGRVMEVSIAIIDFLQKWTVGKRVARVIKCMEQNKATVPPGAYGARFSSHFSKHLVPLPLAGTGGAIAAPPAAKAVLVAVAPAAGDYGAEGQTEERTNSRPIPQETSIPKPLSCA